MADNFVLDRGYGKWEFTVYAPPKTLNETFQGVLETNKDFHVVRSKEGNVLISVPSQNVSYVINKMVVK
jgi:hypothetical protein